MSLDKYGRENNDASPITRNKRKEHLKEKQGFFKMKKKYNKNEPK